MFSFLYILSPYAPQKNQFDNVLSKMAEDASDQKAQFDNEIAKASADASQMKSTFDKMAADIVEQV